MRLRLAGEWLFLRPSTTTSIPRCLKNGSIIRHIQRKAQQTDFPPWGTLRFQIADINPYGFMKSIPEGVPTGQPRSFLRVQGHVTMIPEGVCVLLLAHQLPTSIHGVSHGQALVSLS